MCYYYPCILKRTGNSQASVTAIPVSDQANEVPLDLFQCDSVRNEMQNDVPGVKYSRGDEEEWTPVIRRKKKRTLKKKDLESSSEESCDELGAIRLAREVRYKVQDGVPGLRIRRANTNYSWRWTPISPNPVANRTRSRIKE